MGIFLPRKKIITRTREAKLNIEKKTLHCALKTATEPFLPMASTYVNGKIIQSPNQTNIFFYKKHNKINT